MTEIDTAVHALGERLGLSSLESMDPQRQRLFRAVRDGRPARLKLFDDERNCTAEVEALTILNRGGAPVPQLLGAVRDSDGECAVLTEWWDARSLADVGVPPRPAALDILRQAGRIIGRVHGAAEEPDLAAATFWTRHGYDRWEEIAWRPFLERRLDKWLGLVRLTDGERRAGMDRCLERVAQWAAKVPEPRRWALVHYDFSYRNILAARDGSVVGVIDFENASVGDPVYDLAKLPWVNLTEDDGDLLDAFLGGWEEESGTPVDRVLLDTYVAVQAVAAVAWVDKKDEEAVAHQDFRDRAMRTLAAACARIEGR